MHFFPKSANSIGSKNVYSEIFVLTSTDGKFHIINRSGRVEKSTEAHNGAVLSGRWSYDGTALATAGEDGQVKIWSRSGMLRSTLTQNSLPVYAICWGPDSDQILFTNGRQLVIKPLKTNSKPFMWNAHDGVILAVDWSPVNNLIVSGAEDCKYKVWDLIGRQIFSSSPHDYPITAVAWTPDGELFAIGSYNTLRLCDRCGWSYGMEKPSAGSIFSLAWCSDGTQVAGAGGNGQVVFGIIIERRLEWQNYMVTVLSGKLVEVQDVVNDTVEKLDFRERVVKLSLAFNHLVVATSSQCYLFSTRNWNTPVIFELKEASVTLIKQTEKLFLLVDGTGVYVFSYDGRLSSAPKHQGLKADMLNVQTVSLCNDTVAMQDRSNGKVVHFFDTQTGKALGGGKPFIHTAEVVEIALDQCGPATDRKLAVIDDNHDLFFISVRVYGTERRCTKMAGMVQSVRWNDAANMLTAMTDGKVSVWFYPNAVNIDSDLLAKVVWHRNTSDFGKSPQLLDFIGAHLILRRVEGSLVSTSISQYPAVLHHLVSASRWSDAIRLCRFAKDDTLWACLAAMATYAKELNTAEAAYAAILEVEKVQFIGNIKEIPVKEVRQAEMALLCSNYKEAESILLQAGLVFRAIILNIQLYKWDRALELAVKHKTHVDTVIAYRQRYMVRFQRNDTDKRFLQYQQGMDIDWDKVRCKIELEYQRERERPSGAGGDKRDARSGSKREIV